MYYLQTYHTASLKDYKSDKLSFFLKGNYMGSAEFEFGSVQRSYQHVGDNKNMKLHKVEAKVGNGKISPVIFSVIADDQGLASFKDTIESHLCLERSKVPQTKERTDLWEKFVEMKNNRADFWFSIDRFVHSSNQKPVVAFSDKADLALGFFLHFTAAKLETEKNAWEPMMFEEVFCFKSTKREIFKVAGLNEDDSVTIKGNHKTIRLPSKMVFPVNTSAHPCSAELDDIYFRAGLKAKI